MLTGHHAVAGLASNPAAPSAVLLRVLALDDRWIRYRLKYRAVLPDEVAEAMLHHPDRDVRAALAESCGADPALRARLLDGPAADAMLVAVGPQPYRSTAPALPDWAYERLLQDERSMVAAETANSVSIPAHMLTPLAVHPHSFMREAACRRVWDELSDPVRATLLSDPEPDVRNMAALQVMREDAERTSHLLAAFAGTWRIMDVAEHGRLTREACEGLLAAGEHLDQLARNPTLPADLAAVLATHEDPAVRLAVSARPGLSEQQRAAIDWTVRPEDRLDTLRWVWDARDDPQTLRQCATSAHTWLRRSAAVIPDLPDDCVQRLAEDEDFAVRLLLAENHPNAPAELLLDLYLHGTHRAVAMLVSVPGFPTTGLAARFADAPDHRARALAVRDPGASPELIERLSRDPDACVRAAAAGDPRLPVPRLVELLEDPVVGAVAAANKALPITAMEALLARAAVPDIGRHTDRE
ncbi:hypothetical protein ABZ721_32975 [Streptomyces sp. NPDC006733]|uniref:hypothetical protein n=1 Tax=Streptomyces sp. NPDC006733 TaxID=3155460 RepID=UPI0033D277EE